MTRSHEPLIRLARFKVEELQKQMAELDRSRQALIDQIERLEGLGAGRAGGCGGVERRLLAYGSYAQAVIKRKENIRLSLEEVDIQANALRGRLSEAFQELKKYELLEERRLARIEKAVRAAEQDELDEIAQVRHRRPN